MLSRFIDEIRLLACDAGFRLHLGKVDAVPAKRSNEAAAMSDCRSMICPPMILFLHTAVLTGRYIDIDSGYQFTPLT